MGMCRAQHLDIDCQRHCRNMHSRCRADLVPDGNMHSIASPHAQADSHEASSASFFADTGTTPVNAYLQL